MLLVNKHINSNEIELIKLAKKSNNCSELEELSKSIFISVRRSVAKNKNTSKKIINRLADDPASNVSYWAIKHDDCTIVKSIKNITSCVTCSIDELEYHNTCPSCKEA